MTALKPISGLSWPHVAALSLQTTASALTAAPKHGAALLRAVSPRPDFLLCGVVCKMKNLRIFFATSPALKIDIFWFVLFNEEKNVVVSTALLGSQCQKPMSTFR